MRNFPKTFSIFFSFNWTLSDSMFEIERRALQLPLTLPKINNKYQIHQLIKYLNRIRIYGKHK